MRILDELQMNAIPAFQTIFYDGWVLRFADGYTSNRANSINPIYESTENVQDKINKCEAIFRRKNLKPTYKISPYVYPQNLDMLLENRGYQIIHTTSIQTLSLNNIPEPHIYSVITSSELENLWFDAYCDLINFNFTDKATYKKLLENLVPQRFFTALQVKDEIVACGMGVIENDYIGLFDIVVNNKQRNKGYGTQLLINMLKEGRQYGAKKAYLQVMVNNLPALQLYSKLGFKEEYKYFYRVLQN